MGPSGEGPYLLNLGLDTNAFAMCEDGFKIIAPPNVNKLLVGYIDDLEC